MLKDLLSSCPQAPLWPPESGLKLDTIWKHFRAKKKCVILLMFFPLVTFGESKLELVFKVYNNTQKVAHGILPPPFCAITTL